MMDSGVVAFSPPNPLDLLAGVTARTAQNLRYAAWSAAVLVVIPKWNVQHLGIHHEPCC